MVCMVKWELYCMWFVKGYFSHRTFFDTIFIDTLFHWRDITKLKRMKQHL